MYVLPFPIQENLCDGTEAPPDITALLNLNTYKEGGLAYQVHITRSSLSLDWDIIKQPREGIFRCIGISGNRYVTH